jgi:hypothetical protein
VGKKRRKNLWDCVQRNIKNIHTTKERLWENMNKNMQNKIKSAQKRSAFFPQLGCTWGHAQVIGLSQASRPARLGCPRLAGVVLAWVLPRIAGSGLLVYSTVYHWFVGLLVWSTVYQAFWTINNLRNKMKGLNENYKRKNNANQKIH